MNVGFEDEFTFVPGEAPSFQGGLVDLEELRGGDRLPPFLGNGEGEIGIGLPLTRFRAIDRGMDLQTDIKELSGKEVGPNFNQLVIMIADI